MARPTRRRGIWIAIAVLFAMAIPFVILRTRPVPRGPGERPRPPAPVPVAPKPAPPRPSVVSRPAVPTTKGPVLSAERSGSTSLTTLSGVEGPQLPKSVVVYKELIPENKTIARFHYEKNIIAPGERTDFDIDGSGFTPEFRRLIKIDTVEPQVTVETMSLITPNQIHGTFLAGALTPTRFIHPRVLIQNQPVFVAPDPLMVVRPREVLYAFFTEIGQNGRSALYQIVANLTDGELKTLRVQASVPGVVFADPQRQGPYLMGGPMKVEPGVPEGAHDLEVFLGKQNVFTHQKYIEIVKPTIGLSGIILEAAAENPYLRPGQTASLTLTGSGLHPEDLQGLSAKVEELRIRQTTFTFLASSTLLLSFEIPDTAPLASYPLEIYDSGRLAYRKENAIEVVGPNWLENVREDGVFIPGKTCLLKIQGRGLTEDFAEGLVVSTDEPGLSFGKVSRKDENTLEVPLQIADSVPVGDYLLTFRFKGAEVKPRSGGLIYIGP